MKEVVLRPVRWINRRKFMTAAAGATVGGFLGATVGKSPSAMALAVAPCTGPNGTGRCPSTNCSGAHCAGACGAYNSQCGGTCWTSPQGGTCCDCYCAPNPPSTPYAYYCYCHH